MRKYDEVGGSKSSKDTIFLSKTFKRSTTILAQTLIRMERALSLSAIFVLITLSAGSTKSSKDALDTLALDQKISDMKICMKKQIETQLNNI